MSRGRGGAALLLLTALLCGCATTDHYYLGKRSVKCSPLHDAVEFLPERPSRPFAELAHVEAGQILFFWTRWETLRKHLCIKALGLGADAVILSERRQHRYDIGILPFGIAGDNKKLTGTAIVYLDDDGPQAPEELEAPPLVD